MNVSVDLWPHRLFWMGDPRAKAIFSVKVPTHEEGPWLGAGDWRPWRQRAAVTEGLEGWFRNNEQHLRRDAFATINRFSLWHRSQKYVVRLGATFVDIDCGRNASDCSAEEAAETLHELVELGRLAQTSMFQFSGRGLWAFWLLRDEEDPSTTPFASTANRELWTALQQRVADVIAEDAPWLKLDRPAGEVARVTRLQGSLNPAAGRPAHYELLVGPDGEPVRYGLEELADFYGVRMERLGLRGEAEAKPGGASGLESGLEAEEDRRDLELEAHRGRMDERSMERRRRDAVRVGVHPVFSALGWKGHVTLWQSRLAFLDRVLDEIFGGVIPCGHRFHMLSAYAYCFAKLTRDPAEVAGKVATIGRSFCEQPAEDLMSDAELRGITAHALEWARKGSTITNRKLAAFAGLDPVANRERIERLGLNLATGPKGRNARKRDRRELARKIFQAALDGGEDPPSARKLAIALTERGCATGRTVAHALLAEFWAEIGPEGGS